MVFNNELYYWTDFLENAGEVEIFRFIVVQGMIKWLLGFV